MTYYALDINPEPWAIGDLSVGRNSGGKLYPAVGRNQQLYAYQEAVREAIGNDAVLVTGRVSLKFWFWRRQESHSANARKTQRHHADLTNLQKATEDAIQDLLIQNDKNTYIVRSVMMEQGPDVHGSVVIRVEPLDIDNLQFEYRMMPFEIRKQLKEFRSVPMSSMSEPYDTDIDKLF